jgi:hypothetical protein
MTRHKKSSILFSPHLPLSLWAGTTWTTWRFFFSAYFKVVQTLIVTFRVWRSDTGQVTMLGKAPYAMLIIFFNTIFIDFTSSTYTLPKSVCARSDLFLLLAGVYTYLSVFKFWKSFHAALSAIMSSKTTPPP